MKIIVATRNRGKIAEIEEMLSDSSIELQSLYAFPDLTLPPEDAPTFRHNALNKARYVAEETGVSAIADDSGLEVDALGGAPGVYSARYAGAGATDKENYVKLLAELADAPPGQRTARFRCALAFVDPMGVEEVFYGELEGEISNTPAGHAGFGYDPIFFVPNQEKTLAELGAGEKNRISHRAAAVGKFVEWFRSYTP